MKKNYIFDFGKVLVGYEPHLVYDKYFGSKEKAEWFIKNVVTEGWMRRLDIGEPFNACIKELQAEFPDYADPIGMYDTHYQEMIHGEIEGMYDLGNRRCPRGCGGRRRCGSRPRRGSADRTWSWR